MATWLRNLDGLHGVNIAYQDGWQNISPDLAAVLRANGLTSVRLTINLITQLTEGWSWLTEQCEARVRGMWRSAVDPQRLIVALDRTLPATPAAGQQFAMEGVLAFGTYVLPVNWTSSGGSNSTNPAGRPDAGLTRAQIFVATGENLPDTQVDLTADPPRILHRSFYAGNGTTHRPVHKRVLDAIEVLCNAGISVTATFQHHYQSTIYPRWGWANMEPIFDGLLTYIASRPALTPERFAYALANEPEWPTWGDFHAGFWQHYALARARLPNHSIVVGGPLWCDGGRMLDADFPLRGNGDQNLIVDWHWHWTYGTNAVQWLQTLTEWRTHIGLVRAWAARNGVGIMLGEYGAVTGNTQAQEAARLAIIRQACVEQGLPHLVWAAQTGGADSKFQNLNSWPLSTMTMIPAMQAGLLPSGIGAARRGRFRGRA